MAKKRTSLDSILPSAKTSAEPQLNSQMTSRVAHSDEAKLGKRPHVKQQALYLKLRVHKQLRLLAFEEETKMHDLCLEGLDLLFANRGLPSIAELESEEGT